MDIKCWGSRGSVPVSGKDVIKYGGDTTCIEIVASSDHHIIIDAGTGMRHLGCRYIDNNISDYSLIFTHCHWDHVLGFAFFKPLHYKKTTMTIQDRLFSGGLNTEQVLRQVMKQPFFPIGMEDLNADIRFDPSLNGKFFIGGVEVQSIPTSHPGGGFGYKFTENDKTFVFLTDNELAFNHPGGLGFDAYLDFCKGADLLFHDGEYTQNEYRRRIAWGHSSVDQVVDLGLKAGIRQLGLFHINQDRPDREMDKIVAQCRDRIQKQGSSMKCFAVSCDFKTRL